MKKQLIALGAFLVLALGALPSMASCPCKCDPCYKPVPCCPAAPIATPCCPKKVDPCCPKHCCPAVKPCCPKPCCQEAMPCPAAPIAPCEKKPTCNDCCD